MSEVARRTIGQIPLRKLGELPPEVMLGYVAGLPARMQAALLEKWSAQVSPKGLKH
jgi:hypothetical protein